LSRPLVLPGTQSAKVPGDLIQLYNEAVGEKVSENEYLWQNSNVLHGLTNLWTTKRAREKREPPLSLDLRYWNYD
jgi:hypothetical protein